MRNLSESHFAQEPKVLLVIAGTPAEEQMPIHGQGEATLQLFRLDCSLLQLTSCCAVETLRAALLATIDWRHLFPGCLKLKKPDPQKRKLREQTRTAKARAHKTRATTPRHSGVWE